jgi:hypothetical protein
MLEPCEQMRFQSNGSAPVLPPEILSKEPQAWAAGRTKLFPKPLNNCMLTTFN